MEVSCYSMVLYCDQAVEHAYASFPEVYTGRDRSDCAKQARGHGWRFHKNRTVSCPKCRKRKIPEGTAQ